MTETPEWFQLPDKPEPEPARPKRIALKVALITAPLLLIGGAVVFAENGKEGDDQPNLPTLNTANSVKTSNTQTIITNSSNTDNAPKVAKKTDAVAKVAAPTGLNQSANGIKNPGLPSGKDSEHGFDRHKRPEGHGEHHEGSEHQISGGEDD